MLDIYEETWQIVVFCCHPKYVVYFNGMLFYQMRKTPKLAIQVVPVIYEWGSHGKGLFDP